MSSRTGINLRTNTGRCIPIALPQDCEITIPSSPPTQAGIARFTRPPLASRSCCAGDTGSHAQVSFSVGDYTPPAPPAPVPVGLNLRTTTGHCQPLPSPQECEAGDLPYVGSASVVVRFTRPPLSSRACCSGDQQRSPVPYFDLTISTCEHIELENSLGLFALENGLGTFLLECAP